ncbi:hypothetical protein BDF21DRAFT_428281 [Thamnidium elegans]|nr:hypothetical protein BDF21DRAFT_428281 [Thamnidium elegans]
MKDQQAKQQQQQAAASAAQENARQEPPQESAPQPASQESKESAAEEDQEKAPAPKEEPAPEESEADESESESETEEDDDDEELYRMMIVEGKLKKVVGRKVGERGAIVNSKGKTLGRVEPVNEEESSEEESDSEEEEESGKEDEVSKAVKSETEDVDDDAEKLTDKTGDNADEVIDNVDDFAEKAADAAEEATDEADDATDKSSEVKDAALAGGAAAAGGAAGALSSDLSPESPTVRKSGKIFDSEDNLVGHVDKRLASKLAGYKVDNEGNVYDDEGEIVGTADMIKQEEESSFNPNDAVDEDSPEVKKSGKVIDMEDNIVGSVDKEAASKLVGFKVDKTGNVINHEGHIVAKAELFEKEDPDQKEKPFNPNEAVNEDSPEVKKSGKVLDMEDNVVGSIDKRIASKFAGCKVDPEGNVVDEQGHIVARAEMIKQEESEEEKEEEAPFNPNEAVDEDSPEVRKSGKVFDMDDNLVGHVDKSIASKYSGCKVDSEGNVINKDGDTVGKAEMIKPESEEDAPFNPNEDVDEDSPEVRKSGKIFDMDDNLVGHVDKRIGAKYAGCKVDPEGNVIDKDGHVVARGEMIQEEEKPFNPNQMVNEDSPEVRKSGKVFDMDDNLVGHVDKNVASKYAGCKVDSEGNIINKDGGTVGKAEMIKPEPESESEDEDKPYNPNLMVDENSPEVRRSGKVVDEDDEIVGTVDKGSANQWAGFKVDSYGNVINQDGHTVGKADMIKQISDEERQQQEEDKQYREIADSMSQAVQQSLDKIKPILKEITDNIESEEAKSEKDRDEKKLVETVKPLIEQGSNILGEANGAIRGLDPSGKIAKQAQARTSERKALPEEYHLAELLSQLTGEAKKKRELGPLWNILQSPLLQILSAVGLLLTGVLGLVGNILNGLGLGSIINSLLGGLGFGLGDALKLGKK